MVSSQFQTITNYFHCQEIAPIYKIILLNYGSIRWIYKQRLQQKLQQISENSNVVLEWTNIKTIISRQEIKFWEDTKHLRKKIWDDEIKLIAQQKIFTSKKYLQTKTIKYDTEYKRRRAIAKNKLDHRKS